MSSALDRQDRAQFHDIVRHVLSEHSVLEQAKSDTLFMPYHFKNGLIVHALKEIQDAGPARGGARLPHPASHNNRAEDS